jgi:hypothetical protein
MSILVASRQPNSNRSPKNTLPTQVESYVCIVVDLYMRRSSIQENGQASIGFFTAPGNAGGQFMHRPSDAQTLLVIYI